MSLSAKLMGLRGEKKVSLQVVADAVGVSKPHIWELEKGKAKNPSLELLKELAKYYKVSLDFLADMEPETDSSARFNALFRELDQENMSDADWKMVESSVEFAMNLIKENKNSG